MNTAISESNVSRHDELDDCLIDSIAIADLLMNSQGEAIPETPCRAGFLILSKLERAKKLNDEQWKALQAST